MISIIVSSIHPEKNILFRENIEQTIGVPYELLIHDNRETSWGLCKIYNHYAQLSKYEILCFLHEDILFHTPDWGKILADFFSQTPNAGVVGFAGSTVKTKYLSGWGSYGITSRVYLTQHFRRGVEKEIIHNPLHEVFSPVALLDGMALMTTKKVWKEHPFDEKTFDRFHLYDLDFTMQVAQHYVNYVCFTIKVEHLSNGSYTHAWLEESKKFIDKWGDKLPFSVIPYPEEVLLKCTNYDLYQMIRSNLRYNWDRLSFGEIIRKPKEAKTLLYKSKLIKHIIKATWKKMKHNLKTKE